MNPSRQISELPNAAGGVFSNDCAAAMQREEFKFYLDFDNF